VDTVPDPLLLRKSGSAGNRTRTSGSVARNSDHYITEAVNNNEYCVCLCYVYTDLFALLTYKNFIYFICVYAIMCYMCTWGYSVTQLFEALC
jgi:hypothetical protein